MTFVALSCWQTVPSGTRGSITLTTDPGVHVAVGMSEMFGISQFVSFVHGSACQETVDQITILDVGL